MAACPRHPCLPGEGEEERGTEDGRGQKAGRRAARGDADGRA